MIVWLIYQLLKTEDEKQLADERNSSAFIAVSCCSNCSWLLTLLYDGCKILLILIEYDWLKNYLKYNSLSPPNRFFHSFHGTSIFTLNKNSVSGCWINLLIYYLWNIHNLSHHHKKKFYLKHQHFFQRYSITFAPTIFFSQLTSLKI